MADVELYYTYWSPQHTIMINNSSTYYTKNLYIRVHYSNTQKAGYMKGDAETWKSWRPMAGDDYIDVYGGMKIHYIIDDEILVLPEDSRYIFKYAGNSDYGIYVHDPGRMKFDVSNVDTRYVTNLSYAFYGMQIQDLVGLENGDMSNVEDISYMFSKLPNHTVIYVLYKSTDTGIVYTTFNRDFGNYSFLPEITKVGGHTIGDTSGGRLSKVKTIERFFDGSCNINYSIINQFKSGSLPSCNNFERAFAMSGIGYQGDGSYPRDLDFSNGETATSDVNCYMMFYNLISDCNITLPKTFSNPSIFSNVDKMFYGNTRTQSISVIGDTDWASNSVISAGGRGYQMFFDCNLLEGFDSAKTDYTKANTYSGYFNKCRQKYVSTTGQYIYLAGRGGVISTPYIKTNDGWKESEVYF